MQDRRCCFPVRISTWSGLLLGIVASLLSSGVRGQSEINREFLSVPSAEAFWGWLKTHRAQDDIEHPAHRFISGVQASLQVPTDGRWRFLVPRTRLASKRLSNYLDQAFDDEQKKQFQSFVSQMVEELESAALAREKTADYSTAFRMRWMAAGFQGLRTGMSPRIWPVAEPLITMRRKAPTAKGTHPITRWPASRYQWVQTPHFDLAFQSSTKEAADISEVCEQAFALWQQIFFDCWNTSASVPNYESDPPKPFQVIVFQNRDAYRTGLQSLVPNIGVSTGYYNQNAQASFFYFDRKSYATLIHELTHQFFVEALNGSTAFDADQTKGFWAAEGVALFMESYSAIDLGGAMLVDIGGWDSNRLQAARYRFLRDEMWFPWDSFGTVDGQRFRTLEDIAPRYSQACGLTHAWMEFDAASRESMLKYIASLYRKGTPELLEPSSDEKLIAWYLRYLQRGPEQAIDYLPHDNRNELVLSRSKVDANWLISRLEKKRKWESIDVGFTTVDDSAWTANIGWDIIRLNVESTRITDASVKRIATFPRLQELDLSNCRVTDEGISGLNGNKSLKTLWIAGTHVSDASLNTIASMSKLETLHAQGSKLTNEGWQKLIKLAPRLKASSTGP